MQNRNQNRRGCDNEVNRVRGIAEEVRVVHRFQSQEIEVDSRDAFHKRIES